MDDSRKIPRKDRPRAIRQAELELSQAVSDNDRDQVARILTEYDFTPFEIFCSLCPVESSFMWTINISTWRTIFRYGGGAKTILAQALPYTVIFGRQNLFSREVLEYFRSMVGSKMVREIVLEGNDIPLSMAYRSRESFHGTALDDPPSWERRKYDKLMFCTEELRIKPSDLDRDGQQLLVEHLASTTVEFLDSLHRQGWPLANFQTATSSLLVLTAEAGNIPALRFLTSIGATINQTNPRSLSTALHRSIHQEGVARFLVRKGASLLTADAAGNTPLQVARTKHAGNVCFLRYLHNIIKIRQTADGIRMRLWRNPALLWDAPDSILSDMGLVAFILSNATPDAIKAFVHHQARQSTFQDAFLTWIGTTIMHWHSLAELQLGTFPRAEDIFANQPILHSILRFSTGKEHETSLANLRYVREHSSITLP